MTDTRAILISGATDGLGRALAESLAAAGAHLILRQRKDDRPYPLEFTPSHAGQPRNRCPPLREHLAWIRRRESGA